MLRDKTFKYRYSTGRQDLPIDFCELALSNSVFLNLGLGYFSSACFNVLSTGFARFISNGGSMKLYINQYLTEDDYNILKEDKDIEIEKSIIQSYYLLQKTLSKRDEHFFKCLAYLIYINRVEIKIVVPLEGGIAHEKFGIFIDENNDKVAFTGSMNLTASALIRNIETIDCTCSWKGEENSERIKQSDEDFSEIWEGKSKLVAVYSAKQFCVEILKSYPKVELDELIVQENEIIKKMKGRGTDIEVEQSPIVEINSLPYFPLKYPKGPHPYQLAAYEEWNENLKQGIFAMATGTGKTITSLNCVLQEYLIDGVYQFLVLVPTTALVDQWIDEVSLFNFRNIITVYSQNPHWRKDLVSLKNRIRRGNKENFVIISTYQSFLNSDFQNVLSQLPKDMILIADEAHNIGAESVKVAFRDLKIKRRIALSATPNRIYDAEGTSEVERFFNDERTPEKPNYVFEFPMSKAIKEGRLMEYCYYPTTVYLTDNEMKIYASYSIQLAKLFDSKTGQFKDKQRAENLLMLRKQVLHKAENKISALRKITREIGSERLKYCFIYVPEGKENREESEIEFEDEDSVKLIDRMLEVLKQDFPDKKFNTYIGGVNKSLRKAILTGFEKGDIDVLLAMKCLDEGIDIPRAQYGIFASSSGNPRQFIQRRGRLLRNHIEKEFAYIYDMIVTPDFRSDLYSKEFYEMEKSLVKGELARVAYFADLATNTHFSLSSLKEITDFYQLNLPELIINISQ